MHIVTKNHICGTYWLVGGCWWWFVVILVVFGDFSVFSVIFVVHICHICCHICIIFVILFYGTSKVSMCHKNFFTQFLFTSGGNFGPNPVNPSTHKVVKMSNFREKSHFLTQILIKKNFWKIMPPGISGNTNL